MRAAALLALVALLDCSEVEPPVPEVPWQPDRRDYASFAAAWPDLLEPNYLPFMVHRAPGRDARGDYLFFCRWPDAVMPLPVHVAAPSIPEELQDEFDPTPPAAYGAGVREALATWERALEGLVRFRLVDDPADALLVVRLLGERAPAPAPDLLVLGSTRLSDACRVLGEDPEEADRLKVDFAVEELRLYLADDFGLLPPDQVQWTALHEIGHALGMRGHSPIVADLMFEVARDRIQVREGLSQQDSNSFVSLYRIPNGTIFTRLAPGAAPPPPPSPGPPRLAIAPFVDARHGYELRPPAGWTRITTSHGFVAVDGVTWDYNASFQIVVHRVPTVEAYLERYGDYHASQGRVSDPASLVVNGRRAVQAEVELYSVPRTEQITLVEVGDGRLLAIIADCPRGSVDAFRPWFNAALATLRITDLPEDAWPSDRPR